MEEKVTAFGSTVASRRAAILALAAALAAGTAEAHAGHPPVRGGSVAALPAGCSTALDPAARFPAAGRLRALNARMAAFGARPTGSPGHRRFVSWIERRLRRIPGVRRRSIPYRIDRWLERGVRLRAGAGGRLPRVSVAGVVPYSKRTGRRGVRAPLVYLPPGAEITPEAAAGKIVVRDVVPVAIPNAVLAALMWGSYDPDLSLALDIAGTFERGPGDLVTDLRAAGAARAAGLIYVHGFPKRQVRDLYAPYEGERWRVPAAFAGAGAGARLKRLAAQGAAARLTLRASRRIVKTRTIVATLPGASREKIVVESHTDGVNPLWDNGPIAMLTMLRHFAREPRRCRPRALQFAFTTAHLYQQLFPPTRDGGAEQFAEELDRAYEDGTLAFVMAVEHLGAREYEAAPRDDGGAGRLLQQTGEWEPNAFFAGESPTMIKAIRDNAERHDLRRTIILRGADLPGVRFPLHHSFGGEGGPYHQHLLPTLAFITGPWSLFSPAFGMEAIDFGLMRRQVAVFTDIIHSLDETPRELIAGPYLLEREVRDLLCGLDSGGFGLVECLG